MRTKLVLLCMMSLLLSPGLNGLVNGQMPDFAGKVNDDTVDIAIEYYTVYPGLPKWIVVSMRNPVPVASYNLFFQLSSTHGARFSCSGEQCEIDTTACSSSLLSYIDCECPGEGSAARVWGLGSPGELIPASPDYRCLFKIRMDACCIPDADTLRSAFILLAPATSSVSDSLGNLLPLDYHTGELFVSWSEPGDANCDRLVDAGDNIFLIGYVFRGTTAPCICEAADCNNDYVVDVGDLMYLINYLFLGGPPPLEGGASCWYEDCWP